MDQVRPVHSAYEKVRLKKVISHYGARYLFRTDGNCMVTLILPDPSKGTVTFNKQLETTHFNASELIHHEMLTKRTRTEWLEKARRALHRASELAKMLHHKHMHAVEYFSETTPALYMALHKGSLGTFKDAYWFKGHMGKHPLAFTTNFTLRAHHRGYDVNTLVLGTRLWHDIVKQLADATRFLLDDRHYAHLNLNPNTVLYDFDGKRIQCRITDYASIFPKNEIYESQVRNMPNFVYTLPYEHHRKESHAIAQLLSTLLDLILFDLVKEEAFFIGNHPALLEKCNIWSSIEKVVQHHGEDAISPYLLPLKKIYLELRFHQMEEFEINEYGMLALLFMAPGHKDGETNLDARLKRLLDLLCDKFNP